MAQSFNSTLALTVFVVITLIYISVGLYIEYNPNGAFSKNILLMGYLIVVVVVEYGMNFIISESICKEAQPMSAFISAILSWVLIFIPMVCALVYVTPGWLAPFANTFGHAFTDNDILDKLFKEQGISGEISTLAARINTNRHILINEVTPENFDSFKTAMSSLFNPTERENNLEKLKKNISLKYSISKFIWFILIGILTTSISYNYLLKSSCVVSSSTARKNREKYNKQLNDEQE